jgi:hypothetical protein
MSEQAAESKPTVVEVVMHEALIKDFRTWLQSRGLELHRTPFLDDEDGVLPTYLVTPSQALMDRYEGLVTVDTEKNSGS